MDSMKDIDPEETSEWLEALRAAVAAGGRERGLYLLTQLEQQAQQLGVVAHVMPYSAYQNTLPLDEQAVHPRAMLRSRSVSRRSCVGTLLPWSSGRTRPMASSGATLQPMPLPPKSSRRASILSYRESRDGQLL